MRGLAHARRSPRSVVSRGRPHVPHTGVVGRRMCEPRHARVVADTVIVYALDSKQNRSPPQWAVGLASQSVGHEVHPRSGTQDIFASFTTNAVWANEGHREWVPSSAPPHKLWACLQPYAPIHGFVRAGFSRELRSSLYAQVRDTRWMRGRRSRSTIGAMATPEWTVAAALHRHA